MYTYLKSTWLKEFEKRLSFSKFLEEMFLAASKSLK